MKLLSEEEEDAYLDEGQQAEENVFSVDYDVWIDEETGYTHRKIQRPPKCTNVIIVVLKNLTPCERRGSGGSDRILGWQY